MRISIAPITVNEKVCTEANVSVAVSTSVAIRLVPVDDEGTEYPEAALGIVGTSDTLDIATFMETVAAGVVELAAGRGI